MSIGTARHIRRFFIAAAALVLSASSLASRGRIPARDTLRLADSPDSLRTLSAPDSVSREIDSLARVRQIDSLATARQRAAVDSLDMLDKSSLDFPAFSTAKDSTVEVLSDGHRIMYYYGDVTVEYQDMKLTADYMEFDMNTGIVFARGTKDPVTGEWKGQPTMSQGGATYNMEELRYNFNTRKALIHNMITKEDEGLLHGKNIKMLEDRSINIKNGRYTVCDLEHPHYYVAMSVAKVVTQPSQKTVFGPANFVLEDVPLPIGIPYGFVPKRPSRATGFLMPTFGEESARGFYLRDAGMYFVLGDYFDVSLTADIYTLGSWAVDLNSRYKVNYKFNGNLALTYSVDQTGERGSTDFFQTKNFGVRWSHSQDSKAHPGTSFSASVNFSSPSNSRYNSRSVSEALQNQISSSISYSRNWNGKVNLSVNALHSQNSRDSSYSFTLPNITLSVTRFYPFKRQNRVGKERTYEKISFGYSTTLQNKINFKASEFGGPDFLDKFQNGMTHNFQIGLPSLTLLKYINVTPSVQYGMNWFFRKTTKQYNEETNRVEDVKGKQFGAFGITQNGSLSASASTRIYGLFNFGKHRKLQAIRHVISPSISLSYKPDHATAANGWRTYTYTDKNGEEKSVDYNLYAGQLASVPGKGKTGSMSFSIGNNIEAKVRDLRDTSSTGGGSKKIKIIDQLNLNGSYNFLADSLKMSNIGVSLSTSIFGKLGISANANFDPYAIDERGRRINTFNVVKNGILHPLRLNNASASLSYSISGKGAIKGNDGRGGGGGEGAADYYKRIYYHPITGEPIPGGWLYYTNPNVPWSANFNYSFSYSRSYSYTNNQLVVNNLYQQTLGVSGNVKLTPRMSLQFNSGFDLMAMKMTTTQISARYDLHCFNISVSWVPTGTWKSYSFLICANASSLADLLRFKKSSSYWDN